MNNIPAFDDLGLSNTPRIDCRRFISAMVSACGLGLAGIGQWPALAQPSSPVSPQPSPLDGASRWPGLVEHFPALICNGRGELWLAKLVRARDRSQIRVDLLDERLEMKNWPGPALSGLSKRQEFITRIKF